MQAFLRRISTTFTSIIVGVVLISGCTVSSVVHQSNDKSQVKALSSAKVVWEQQTALSYTIRKSSAIGKPNISDDDKDEAKVSIEKIWKHFDKNVASSFESALAARGVSTGEQYIIELKPSAGNFGNAGTRGFDVMVSVKSPNVQRAKWWITIRALGTASQSDQAIMEKFVSTAIDELAKVGWIK